MRALESFRANDPKRPTICLIHGLNSSSRGFVHVIPLLEEAGYGIVVYDYPYNRSFERVVDDFRAGLGGLSARSAGPAAVVDRGALDGGTSGQGARRRRRNLGG